MAKLAPINWKLHLGDLWDGRKVYVVDGTYVRDNFFADFVEGSNCCAYPEFVPKNEIWLERDQTPEDLMESLIHEIIECTLMCYGIKKTYNPAHDATNTVSTLVRKARHINDKGQSSVDHVKKLAKMKTYPEAESAKAPSGDQSAPGAVPLGRLVKG
jgi:hypothetical protein